MSSSNLHYGKLKGPEITQWIRRQPDRPADLMGGVRILFCEKEHYSMHIDLDAETFEVLEECFHLPASTIPSFAAESGTYSRYLTREDGDASKLTRIGLVIKVPQKREIANFGLAMSYDVATGFTTAFLFATDIVTSSEIRSQVPATISQHWGSARGSILEKNIDRDILRTQNANVLISATKRGIADIERNWHLVLLSLIADFQAAWSHPMCLPSIALTDHLLRTKHYCNGGKPMQETWAIEEALGVTFVGKPYDNFDTGHKDYWQKTTSSSGNKSPTRQISRVEAEALRVRINTQITRLLFTSRAPEMNKQCSEYMLALHKELSPLLPQNRLNHPVHDTLADVLEFNLHSAESVRSHVSCMKDRVANQLNVLYTVIAQEDNRLSARLAANSGRDSTSMKILALITAFFLPGTFAATLFSMGMFDWKFAENSSTVSNQFYVYWATAIPLTAITLAGWAFWWRIEMRTFQKTFAEAMNEGRE